MARGLLAGGLLLMTGLLQAQPDAQPRTDLYGDPLPKGALARLGSVRFRYGAWGLKGLVFTPDGKMLIGATEDRTIHFWDVATGRRLREVSTGKMWIQGLALSYDGKQMAVGGTWHPDEPIAVQGAVRILETSTGKELRVLARQSGDLSSSSLAFTPDGKWLLSYGNSGVFRVEELATGAEILQQRFEKDVIAQMAMSPDGSTVAVATGPNTHKLYVWKWQAGEEPKPVTGPTDRPDQLTFSPDGKWLAIKHDFREPTLIWDVAAGRPSHFLAEPGLDDYLSGRVVFSPDGRTIVAAGRDRRGYGGSLHIWDAATGKHLERLDVENEVGVLTFSADGLLLAGASGGCLRLWDFAARRELSADPVSHRGHIGRMAILPHDLVATASDDQTVRVWELKTGKQRLKLKQRHWVRAIACSPDGSRLASSGLDDWVHVWDVNQGKEVYALAGHGEMGGRRSLLFAPDGQRLLSFGDDRCLRIWSLRNGKALAEHRPQPSGVELPGEDDPIRREMFFDRGAVFSPDGRLLIWNILKFHIFDTETGKELGTISPESASMNSMTISPDSKHLLIAAYGRGRQVTLPDGSIRGLAAKTHPVGLWDLATHKLVHQTMLPGDGIGPVTFAADGRTFAVATSGAEHKIAIHEVAGGEERFVINGVPGRVTALAFSGDGRYLISALQDNTALVWDVTRER